MHIKLKTKMCKPSIRYYNQQIRETSNVFGYGNYQNKYSPKLAEIGDSLTELTTKNVLLVWGPEYTETFEAVKKGNLQ